MPSVGQTSMITIMKASSDDGRITNVCMTTSSNDDDDDDDDDDDVSIQAYYQAPKALPDHMTLRLR